MPNTPFTHFKKRLKIRSLCENYADIAAWYQTPLGQNVLRAEQQIISEQLTNVFGYHLMQISSAQVAHLAIDSRINHNFCVIPCYNGDREQHGTSATMADLHALPFPDESIDVTILHHVLEFSKNPHQVLKEAARVTVARGHIVIVGFNPLSVHGVVKPFMQLMDMQSIWARRSLGVYRLRDWLEFLDFSCLSTKYAFHRLPVNNASYLKFSRRVFGKMNLQEFPFGAAYCIVARKDKVSLTPIKPNWRKAQFGGLSKPLSPARAGKMVVVPFKKRTLKKD